MVRSSHQGLTNREVKDNPVRSPYDWDMEDHGTLSPDRGRKKQARRWSRLEASAATRRLPAGLTR